MPGTAAIAFFIAVVEARREVASAMIAVLNSDLLACDRIVHIERMNYCIALIYSWRGPCRRKTYAIATCSHVGNPDRCCFLVFQRYLQKYIALAQIAGWRHGDASRLSATKRPINTNPQNAIL